MDCKSLGELCDFYRGASVPRARMYDNGDILYIHYGDLYKGFEYKIDVEAPQSPLPFILANEAIKPNQILCDQDIVYVLTSETEGDLGHSFLFNNLSNRIAVAGTETTIVRVRDKTKLLPVYLNYLMHTPEFLKKLRQYVRGMKVFRVHPMDVARIEIEVPSVEKQQKVVSVLDAIYEKQQINSRINDYLAAICETLATSLKLDNESVLADISVQVTEKVLCTETSLDSYVTTESLLPDKGGRQVASSLPETGKVTAYRAGDTLISNIRPYFKKIWFADRNGACSSDVMVFRAKEPSYASYLYSVLRSDKFFKYVMAGAKGTKMPRGDKTQMMQYSVALECNKGTLAALTSIVGQIGLNNRESETISSLRDALLPKLMSGEIDVSQIDITQLNNHLSDC